MSTIDALTIPQRLALAHFIEAYLRLRGSMHWRTAFYECTRRGRFCPYASTEEAIQLVRLAHDFGPLIVCQFRTADVQRAAHTAAELHSVALSSGLGVGQEP